MRTALLSAIKRTGDDELRAFLSLGGRTVLAWQFDLAIKLGCERIVCLCEAPQPEILALQHEAERVGCEFHAINGPLQLVSLFTADQDLVVLADGLVVAPDLAEAVLSRGQAVVTMPSSSSLAVDHPEDFERIDAERVWAGLARMRGNLIAKLADLPGDCDVVSLLLRLALQAGVSSQEIDPAPLADGRVLLAVNAESLGERQRVLLDQSGDRAPLSAPFLALASFVARKLAPKGLQKGPVWANFMGLGLLIAAGLLSWTEYSLQALFAGAVGTFVLALASAGTQLRAKLYGKTIEGKNYQVFSVLRDVLVVTILAIPAISLTRLAVPVFAVGLIIVAARDLNPVFGAFWSDRTLHLLFWAGCTAFGQFIPGITALGLLALGHILLRKGKI